MKNQNLENFENIKEQLIKLYLFITVEENSPDLYRDQFNSLKNDNFKMSELIEYTHEAIATKNKLQVQIQQEMQRSMKEMSDFISVLNQKDSYYQKIK